MYWITQDKRKIKLLDMETTHLFNCFRMIFNHLMPNNYKTHDYIRYSYFNKDYMIYMLPHLAKELGTRLEQLNTIQQKQFLYMCKVSNVNTTKCLFKKTDRKLLQI